MFKTRTTRANLRRLGILASLTLSPSLILAESTNYYDETVITSSRVETPLRQVATSMSVVTKEQLQQSGQSSLADVLRTQTGIAVSNNGGLGQVTSLRIRGEEGYRTLVMIDGVDMSDPTGTQIGPQFQHLINSQELERVEILRGPQGFMYGADAGGVVNIITASEVQGFSGGISAETGSNSTQNLGVRLSAGFDQLSFSAAYSDFSTDGFNARSNDSLLADRDGAENQTLHLKANWQITEKTELTLVHRDIFAENEFDNCGFPTRHDCLGVSEQSNFKATMSHDLDNSSHALSWAVTDVSRDSFAGGNLSFGTEGETEEIEYVGSYTLTSSQMMIFGADYEEDRITTPGRENDRDQLGLFAEYQWNLNDRFYLTAGLRNDDNSDFGRHNSWRTSAAYVQELDSGNSLKYRSTYGTGFRAPSLSELAYNSGPFAFGQAAEITLQEETSQGYDLGIDYLRSSGALFQITYFDQQIDNEIFFDLLSFSGYLQEGGTTSSRGVELSASSPVSLPLPGQFELSANYTYNETSSRSDFTRSRRPEQVGNIGIVHRSFEDRLQIATHLRLSRDSYDSLFGVGLVPLDDSEVLDLSAIYRFDSGLELFARVENLLDEQYVEVTNFNTQGRAGYTGVRFNF